MQTNSDVNPAFAQWRSSTGREKEWALQVLVQRMERMAMAICWQRLPDHKNELEELTNRIVWLALKYAKNFKSKSKFSTWYYKVALNECNKFLRSYKKRCETSLEDEMAAPRANVDAKIDLIALLDGLQGEDHLMFRLVAEGQDWNTIAKTLAISPVAARVRWSRLKEKLRDAIL